VQLRHSALTATLGLAASFRGRRGPPHEWDGHGRRDRARFVARKLMPAKAAIDGPLALAIVGLGILIVIAPSSVSGLSPTM
jgi:hypothetical protein